jgi:hypothetical protein
MTIPFYKPRRVINEIVYIEDSLDISGSGSQSDQFQKQFYRQKKKQPNKNYEWNEEDHKNFLEAIEKFKD